MKKEFETTYSNHVRWTTLTGGKEVSHRLDGPSWLDINKETGVVFVEKWSIDGRLHRDDGPAYISRKQINGDVLAREYYKHGVLHRLDGPAFEVFDVETGVCVWEQYFVDGVPYREDGGPVQIERDSEGNVIESNNELLSEESG